MTFDPHYYKNNSSQIKCHFHTLQNELDNILCSSIDKIVFFVELPNCLFAVVVECTEKRRRTIGPAVAVIWWKRRFEIDLRAHVVPFCCIATAAKGVPTINTSLWMGRLFTSIRPIIEWKQQAHRTVGQETERMPTQKFPYCMLTLMANAQGKRTVQAWSCDLRFLSALLLVCEIANLLFSSVERRGWSKCGARDLFIFIADHKIQRQFYLPQNSGLRLFVVIGTKRDTFAAKWECNQCPSIPLHTFWRIRRVLRHSVLVFFVPFRFEKGHCRVILPYVPI